MSDLNYLKKPNLKKPIVVAGLPGIALIGKIAVEYLIEKLNAEKFAELSSDKFPGWVIRESGLIRNLKVDFYYASAEGLKRDLILITADAQASSPKDQYDLSEEILEVLSEEGVDTILTMAAFLNPEGEKSPVVGAATNSDLAEEISSKGVDLLSGGQIVGMNGLLVSLAADKEIQGFCLLGTTQGKGKDPGASKEVLSVFSKIFDLSLDLSDFEDEVPDLPKFKPPKIKMPSVSGGESDLSYIL